MEADRPDPRGYVVDKFQLERDFRAVQVQAHEALVLRDNFQSPVSAGLQGLDDAPGPQRKIRLVVDEEIEVIGVAMMQVAARGRRAASEVEAGFYQVDDLENFILERVERLGIEGFIHGRIPYRVSNSG